MAGQLNSVAVAALRYLATREGDKPAYGVLRGLIDAGYVAPDGTLTPRGSRALNEAEGR